VLGTFKWEFLIHYNEVCQSERVRREREGGREGRREGGRKGWVGGERETP